jgi:hypothetical protein
MSSPPMRNLILDYYDRLPSVIARCVDDPAPVKDPAAFSPGFLLPELDPQIREFFGGAQASWSHLADLDGGRLTMLDLTRNPGTRTTKTLASLLIVARAVEYIRRTGEPIVIFSPTSANKGTALRDAVFRAYECGLVTPDQLRIAIVVPAGCRAKLRGGLPTDRNPIFVYAGEQPEYVKALGRQFADAYAGQMAPNLWFSLELRNYLIADAARAFFEHDVDPTPGAKARTHAHAVSSAFGLLGYNLGRDLLEESGAATPEDRPSFLLVQHMGTPDMVLSLLHGDFDRARVPAYQRDGAMWRQAADPHFPSVTADPEEVLDPTFYTHRPVTSPAMNDLIRRHGGDGIVVSLQECLERYPKVAEFLSATDRPLPADLRTLREWSIVMAVTGVLNAFDRGLLDRDRDVVVHGTGMYHAADYPPVETADLTPVQEPGDIARVLLADA